MFKRNLQDLAAFKTFEYRTTQVYSKNGTLFTAMEEAGGQQ